MMWKNKLMVERRAKARRDYAIQRNELRNHTTSPRVSADGPTAMAIKAEDPALRKLIDDALARRAN